MSDAEATRWIILAMVILGVDAVARSLQAGDGLPSVRVPIAILLVGAFLSLAAEPAPQLAGALAALLVVTTILSAGRLWQVAEQLTSSPTP